MATAQAILLRGPRGHLQLAPAVQLCFLPSHEFNAKTHVLHWLRVSTFKQEWEVSECFLSFVLFFASTQ